jgi:hypothetical protein
MASLKVDEVKVRDDVIVISILETKTKRPRTNCITEPLWIGLIKKYTGSLQMTVWSSQPWKKNLLFRFFETDAKF